MYQAIEAKRIGLADADSAEDIQRGLIKQLNAMAAKGYRVVAATAEFIIMAEMAKKKNGKVGRPRKVKKGTEVK